jgi:hypothetical protein
VFTVAPGCFCDTLVQGKKLTRAGETRPTLAPSPRSRGAPKAL